MRNIRKFIVVATVLLLSLLPALAIAAPPTLDPTFDDDGIAIIDVGSIGTQETATAVVVQAQEVQADGKIVVGGYTDRSGDDEFALLRYNPDGSPDATFGADGVVTTRVAGSFGARITALVLQPDGKIIAAGDAFNRLTLARYNNDGTLDSSFGQNGLVTHYIPGSPDAYAVALHGSDGILAAGRVNQGGNQFLLARFLLDGTPDVSFGNNGVVVTSVTGGQDWAYALAVQSNGAILVAGEGDRDFALVRYSANGAIDTGFGVNGIALTDLGGIERIRSIAVQPDGRIVATGNGSIGLFVLLRYNADGSPDGSFGNNGVITRDMFFGREDSNALLLQSDGRIVVAGRSNESFAVARFNSDGTLDQSFDQDGKLSTQVHPSPHASSRAAGLAVQANGKLVVVGSVILGSNFDFDMAIVRYNADGSLDAGFDGDGIVTANLGTVTSTGFPHAMAVQADGKAVIVGDIYTESGGEDLFVLRLNGDGSPDPAFGSNGTVSIDNDNHSNDDAAGVAILPDGKLLVAGHSNANFYLYRLLSDGSHDASFASGGRAHVRLGNGGFAADMAVADNGGVIVIGSVYGPNGSLDLAATRWRANGALDTTFGVNGVVLLDIGGGHDYGYALALQSDGALVLAGQATVGGVRTLTIVRMLANGALDTSFANGGIALPLAGIPVSHPPALAMTDDGRIVAVTEAQNDYALVRLLPDGSLDASLDSDGIALVDVAGNGDPYELFPRPDGGTIVVGSTYVPSSSSLDFSLVRFNPDGSLDTDFDGDGLLTTDNGRRDNDYTQTAALDPNGSLLVAGASRDRNTGQSYWQTVTVARYLNLDPNQPPVAVDSAVTTAEDTAVVVKLSASDGDGDPLTYTLLSTPGNGSLSSTAPNLTYTPNLNFHGSDSFTFKVNDGTVDSNIATVNITVNPVNDDPTVTADTATVTVDEGQTANNSGTLGDVDGDSVTLSASVGSVTNNNNGTWSWSFASSDGPAESQTVTISADDGNGGSAEVTFSLTVDNVAPTVEAGTDQTVNRNDTVTVSGAWTDQAGAADDAYVWSWDLDGDSVADVSNGGASYGDTANATTSYATKGVYTLTFSVSDKDGGSHSDSLKVTVLNVDPVCTNAAPSVTELWPPNHQMVPVSILGVTDAENDPIAISIDSIFQDEPVDGGGDGSTTPDGAGIGTPTAEVRAERAGGGNGRYYHISYTADDGHGGDCSGVVQVSVPKSQGKKGAAVDDGPLYDSTAVTSSAASLGRGEAVMQPWLFLPVVAGQ